MILKSSRSFSLLEVVITVAILSTALVFIFRSFTTMLSSVKISQNITLACWLAEDKFWEIEQGLKSKAEFLDSTGQETIQGTDFKWNYTIEPQQYESINFTKLELTVTWQENNKRERKVSIDTYIIL